MRHLGELAREERCDFAIVCGDVFESSQVERRTLARALAAIAGFPVPVYLSLGRVRFAAFYLGRGMEKARMERVQSDSLRKALAAAR